MYKVIKGTACIEGKTYITYGLSYNDETIVSDISDNKQKVEQLAELFNKEQVELEEIELFIEEFLADRY
ncbi:MAG: hypothetical protein IJE01_05605 [Clostridia bacterium]|nr:hypothetical protein [Clostridia bacterium]